MPLLIISLKVERSGLTDLNHMEKNHNVRDHIEVRIRKLDNIIRESMLKGVDLIKIDVEGAELDVLLGCVESIKNKMVKNIICEIHEPIASRKDIISLLWLFCF